MIRRVGSMGVAFAVTSAILAFGASSPSSAQNMRFTKETCTGIGVLMPAHPPRVPMEGFSIKPPAGELWCGVQGLYHGSVDFFAVEDENTAIPETSSKGTRQVWLFARRVSWDAAEPAPQTLKVLTSGPTAGLKAVPRSGIS